MSATDGAEKISDSLTDVANAISGADSEHSLAFILDGLPGELRRSADVLEHLATTQCECTEHTVRAIRYAGGDIAEATKLLAREIGGLAAAIGNGLSELAEAIRYLKDGVSTTTVDQYKNAVVGDKRGGTERPF
jgi:hypothetical protein